MLFCQPIFNMVYMYYTIYTIKQKSWGGVRVDQTNPLNNLISQSNNDFYLVPSKSSSTWSFSRISELSQPSHIIEIKT